MKEAKRKMHEEVADEGMQTTAEHLLLETFRDIRRAEKDVRYAYELQTWEFLRNAVAMLQNGRQLPNVPDEKERNKIARLIARHIKREFKRDYQHRK